MVYKCDLILGALPEGLGGLSSPPVRPPGTVVPSFLLQDFSHPLVMICLQALSPTAGCGLLAGVWVFSCTSMSPRGLHTGAPMGDAK